MVRASGTQVEQNFVNGLITEATGMNFPENACTSATNVVFKETGEVTRRLGYDYESAYQLNSKTIQNSAIVEFEWTAAAGNGDVNFIVQQVGGTISFYRISTDNSLSAGLQSSTISLSSFQVAGSPTPDQEPCSFASGKGFLFVTNKYCEPFFVSYDADADTFTATEITIVCRDFEGVDDGLDAQEQPLSLSDAHEYNLLNQGWDATPQYSGGGGATAQVIDRYFTVRAVYPSNSEQWFVVKDTSERFYPDFMETFFQGNSLAPKGHYLLDWFNTDRSGSSTRITSVTERSAGYFRPSTCAFFAGRVWYAGVQAADYVGEVYYTQVIERDDQLGACHQINDPTSEHLADLLDTDGGIARVLDMGTVYRLFATQKALLIFASNGIWSISGSDVASFKATDYTIKKISSNTVASGLPFVDALGTPIFWTEDGIWTVAYEAGDFSIVSLSDKRIKQYFKDIPQEAKKWAKGAFNKVDKIVQWVFASTSPQTVDERYSYDSVLTLNTVTGAFYPWTIYSATKEIKGIIACGGPVYGLFDTVVDGSGDTVIDASGNTVVVFNESASSIIKFFVVKNSSGTTYNTTFAVEGNTAYLDWIADAESYDYTSSFTSGYRLHADGNKEYQANYVTFICTDETSSSAFVQGVWDFANSTLSKKWSAAQQIYNSTPTYRDYRIRKIKIRGWGKALQFRVYSATGVPFNIVGWSAFETANSVP